MIGGGEARSRHGRESLSKLLGFRLALQKLRKDQAPSSASHQEIGLNTNHSKTKKDFSVLRRETLSLNCMLSWANYAQLWQKWTERESWCKVFWQTTTCSNSSCKENEASMLALKWSETNLRRRDKTSQDRLASYKIFAHKKSLTTTVFCLKFKACTQTLPKSLSKSFLYKMKF